MIGEWKLIEGKLFRNRDQYNLNIKRWAETGWAIVWYIFDPDKDECSTLMRRRITNA